MVTLRDGRVDWVDYAKGFCIIMVVMMHSTLGVEAVAGREGWMHAIVDFARPFRMPDFFLISGLFLSRVIDRDWRTYLDRKVVHFAYFYVLWVTIQFAFKAPGIAAASGWPAVLGEYALAYVEPFGTLWFIYLLPIFFVVTKALRRVPPLLIVAIAAVLEIAPIHTGWIVIDEFAARFVYFYCGYWLAPHIFALAGMVRSLPVQTGAALLAWALLNGALVLAGVADYPVVSLLLGFVGGCAVVSAAVLMSMAHPFAWLRYLGQHSLMVYLAFFLPMAATRAILLKTGLIPDIGTDSLLVTAAGVFGAVLWHWAARRTPLRFLFERPAAFHLAAQPMRGMQPAE